jgi:hypothetical protein
MPATAFDGRGSRRVVGRIATLALSLQAVEIGLPEFVTMPAEVVEHVPRIETTIVPVAENRLDRVVADWFDALDRYVALADLKHFLPRSVTAGFRRRCKDAQVLIGEFKTLPGIEGDLEDAGFLMQLDLGRRGNVIA